MRLRCMTPPPQSFEHALYSLQSPITQSIGHGWMLHACISIKGGHAAPPFGCTTIVRIICCSPPAHIAEHSPGIHSETTQSCMKGFWPFIWNNSWRIVLMPQSVSAPSVILSTQSLRCIVNSAIKSLASSTFRRIASSAVFRRPVEVANFTLLISKVCSQSSVCALYSAATFAHSASISSREAWAWSRAQRTSAVSCNSASRIIGQDELPLTEHFFMRSFGSYDTGSGMAATVRFSMASKSSSVGTDERFNSVVGGISYSGSCLLARERLPFFKNLRLPRFSFLCTTAKEFEPTFL